MKEYMNSGIGLAPVFAIAVVIAAAGLKGSAYKDSVIGFLIAIAIMVLFRREGCSFKSR